MNTLSEIKWNGFFSVYSHLLFKNCDKVAKVIGMTFHKSKLMVASHQRLVKDPLTGFQIITDASGNYYCNYIIFRILKARSGWPTVKWNNFSVFCRGFSAKCQGPFQGTFKYIFQKYNYHIFCLDPSTCQRFTWNFVSVFGKMAACHTTHGTLFSPQ